MRKIVFILCAVLLCFSVISLVKAQESDQKKHSTPRQNLLYNPDLITSAASLAYLSGDDLNLLGSFLFDFPFLVKNEKSAYLNLRLASTLSKEKDFRFKVYDTDYQITVGARDYLTRKIVISAFVSQQGSERADADGSPFIRFVGFAMESSDYSDFSSERGLFWYSEIGAIFEKREVDAEITFKGKARWNYLPRDGIIYGLDFKIDTLLDDFNTFNDWSLGPRLSFCADCSHAPSLFLYYVNSNNPLGINDDGFMMGFDYRNKRDSKEFKNIFPNIRGHLSAGAGEGREATHFGMKLRSPSFSDQKPLRVSLEVDQYILTDSDTGDLYYVLAGGPEYSYKNLISGAYFYHRSNHQLAEPNNRITSRNIFELGISSKGWNRKEVSDGLGIYAGSWKYPAQFNFLLRGGYLINSSFEETRQWNIRSGARIDFPIRESKFSPYLSAIWEGGEVSRKEFHLGMRTPLDLDLAIVYRKDEQYYSEDRELFLFEANVFY